MQYKIKWRFAAIQADMGLSNKAVAQLIGVSASTVSRYRHSNMPQLDGSLLLRICLALDCQPDALIRIEEVPHD
jgi:DNA-binding Xre family transcriptional regulator